MATTIETRLDTHGAKSLLRKAFAKNPNPSEEELEKLSKECGRPTRIVSKWYVYIIGENLV